MSWAAGLVGLAFLAAVGLGHHPQSTDAGGAKERKLRVVPNDYGDGKGYLVNGKALKEGMTFLEMLNAIGHAPNSINFDKESFHANYTHDEGGITIYFTSDGRISLFIYRRFY